MTRGYVVFGGLIYIHKILLVSCPGHSISETHNNPLIQMVIGIKSSYSTPVDKDLNKTIDVFI